MGIGNVIVVVGCVVVGDGEYVGECLVWVVEVVVFIDDGDCCCCFYFLKIFV